MQDHRGKIITTSYQKALETSGSAFRCVKLSERTIALLSNITEFLGWSTRYEKATPFTEQEKHEILSWGENAYYELNSDETCTNTDVSCADIQPNHSGIVYYPTNPYTEPETVPAGYIVPPFSVVNAGMVSEFFGLLAGDILVPQLALPFFGWNVNLTVPSIRWEFSGKGELEVHLIKQPQGGLAVITIDDDIGNTHFVDLNTFGILDFETWIDLIKIIFPSFVEGGVYAENILEFPITTDGNHSVEVRFFPRMGVDIILGFGGGFRKFTWCSDMANACCPQTNKLQLKIVNQNDYFYSQQLYYLDDGDDPRSFAPDAPEQFDSNEGDEHPAKRQTALCDAVYRYVWTILEKLAWAFQDTADFIDTTQNIPEFDPVIGIAKVFAQITASALHGLVLDREAVNAVICHMVENLEGQVVDNQIFADCVNPLAFSPLDNEFQVASIIDASNGMEDNYRAFVAILGKEYQKLVAGAQSMCPCDCPELQIFDYAGTGVTITYMGSCIYRFENSNAVVQGGVNRYFGSLREQYGRAINVQFPPAGSGFSAQAVSDTESYHHPDCGGSDYNSVGGFADGIFERVKWRQSETPMDTYYRITLAEC